MRKTQIQTIEGRKRTRTTGTNGRSQRRSLSKCRTLSLKLQQMGICRESYEHPMEETLFPIVVMDGQTRDQHIVRINTTKQEDRWGRIGEVVEGEDVGRKEEAGIREETQRVMITDRLTPTTVGMINRGNRTIVRRGRCRVKQFQRRRS